MAVKLATRKFGFYFEGTDLEFVRCLWPIKQRYFVLYHAFLILYMLPFLPLEFLYFTLPPDKPKKWMVKCLIYPDRWVYIVILVYFIVALSTQLCVERRSSRTVRVPNDESIKTRDTDIFSEMPSSIEDSVFPPQLKWYLKMRWALFNIAFNVELIMSLMFWIWYYYDVNVLSLNRQLIVLLLLIIEAFTISHPLYVHHFWHAYIFLVPYCIFMTVYLLSGGTDQYGDTRISRAVDSENPGQSILIISSIVIFVVPTCQCFVTLMAFLRNRLFLLCTQRVLDMSSLDVQSEKLDGGSHKEINDTVQYSRDYGRSVTFSGKSNKITNQPHAGGFSCVSFIRRKHPHADSGGATPSQRHDGSIMENDSDRGFSTEDGQLCKGSNGGNPSPQSKTANSVSDSQPPRTLATDICEGSIYSDEPLVAKSSESETMV